MSHHPSRCARGVSLGRALTLLSAHFPASIATLLAEALVLTGLMGSLLKDAEGQVTLQAQTENGIIDLLVCDYRDGELRGYVRHDGDRLADAGPHPSLFALFGKGYLAITFDHPKMDERYQGIVPLEGESLAQAAQSFFAQSEQIPSLVRLAAEKRDGGWVAGGVLFQHLPEGEEGRERLETRLDHPDWPHVAILAGSVKPGTDRSVASARRPRLALFNEETRCARSPRSRSAAAAAATGYVRSVIAKFPPRSAPRWSGRRQDHRRLRILLVEF